MSLVIRTAQPARSRARKYLPPVMRGLDYLFLGDADDPGRNWAIDRADGEINGTPVRAPDGISWRFKGFENFVETPSWEVDDETHFIVCRTFDTLADDAHRPAFFGTYTGPPVKQDTSTVTAGTRLYISAAGQVNYGAGRGTTVDDDEPSIAGVSAGGVENYRLYLCQAAAQNRITNVTTGATFLNSVTKPRFPARRRYRLGSAYVTNGGECDVLLWAKFSAVLTSDENAAMVDDIRRYCTDLGVTV
ncbi:hypothetical protein [Paracoccus sp. SSJ]|uniref:hypothetical protein n=1 Tax=Paracoccus sp. SSJ TaxID=3050636 RepID=UPI00254DC576|nr:hypothetical protein [Paracoccus sp. SSJ]MDK8871481.1 hypothetical protein [Paracoccus sp. SSJ]MDK8874678.1 hypothetical protein [Paracoccus sp. SSJ]